MELLFVLATLGLILYLIYHFFFRSGRILPPSPKFSIPVLGHLHLLGKLPHISLMHLAEKYGGGSGFMYLKLGTVDTLIVSSAAAAKEVLKTQDHLFASRPAISSAKYFGYGGAGLAWAPYGDHWRQTRKLCTLELLTTKRVQMFQPVRRSEMLVFLQEVLSCSRSNLEVDLTTKLKDITFNSMAKMVMNKSYSSSGASENERRQALFFNETITAAFAAGGSMHLGDFIPWLSFMDTQVAKIKALRNHLDEFLQTEVEEHRAARQGDIDVDHPKDFIDVMISTGVLSDDSVKAISLDMIAAGTDTSAVAVEWAMAELINHPNVMKKVQEELERVIGSSDRLLEEDDIDKLEYLQAVVKETLRLHPPVPLLLPHESIQSCGLLDGKFVMPRKTRLFVNAYAISRDPAVWKDPLKFDPERFVEESSLDVRGQNFELLPFGSGRRSCPGILLGMTSVQFILGSLLHAFEWEIMGGGGGGGVGVDMSEEFGITVPRASPLKLVASPRLAKEAYENKTPKHKLTTNILN